MIVIRHGKKRDHIEEVVDPGQTRRVMEQGCPTVKRYGSDMSWGQEFTDLAQALRAARVQDAISGASLCKHCEKSALGALEAARDSA